MNRTFKHIIIVALLLLTGSAVMAQNDPQYVIKRRTDAGSSEIHYLAHVKNGDNWQLQDATEFSPDCVWYSGNTVDNTGVNHNYYFMDGNVYHFLSAELSAEGPLSLSSSQPSPQLLRNPEQVYYFYDWDWDNKPIDGAGVARGLQHTGLTQEECEQQLNPESWNANSGNGECWEVYWVECYPDNNTWKLSSSSNYHMTTNSARFRLVTVNEILTPVSGGLQNLNENSNPTTGFEVESVGESHSLSSTLSTPYRYIAYTSYVFEGQTHNYYNVAVGGPSADHGTSVPESYNGEETTVSSYQWIISGPGADYLSFQSGSNKDTIIGATPTIYYRVINETGHKTAALTLTVTYNNGATQVLSVPVTVKTPCGNPLPDGDPVITYDHVTVSWVNTSDQYHVYWKKDGASQWNDSIVSNVSSFTFAGLDYNTTYYYKVAAFCSDNECQDPAQYSFKTMKEPDLLIYGSVFGGGRMADVNGNTEVVIINCDTIGAVYGGNDIAGSVLGTQGSNIVLGIDASTATDSYAHLYNGDNASVKVRVNDVYGGGNGYYAYNGSSFEAATSDYPTATIASDASVTALSESHQWTDTVWTNQGTEPETLTIPSIVKTAITVTNDQVKVDSIFGGAKNAFLTTNDGNGSTIDINGGTILAVYGGNNYGGSQGYGRHKINVSKTTTRVAPGITNSATTGYGRDFGIRYLFGGGNKVAGSTTDITITGGQLDTIFGGGNEADVYAANLTVECALGAYTGTETNPTYTYGNTYTMAINPSQYSTGTIGNKTIDTVNYPWDGFTGVYNVRTLFGGSNQAAMNGVPTVNLTSGSVGTVYGGGNAGDMLSHSTDDGNNQELVINGDHVKYGTHVVMNSPTMLIDNLYGGCQVSNVDFSTWVEIKNGHVGHVYGGCNVSGDVGSTKINPDEMGPKSLEYQAVQGGTYVVATGGVIYKDLFAGGNGFYHCNNGINYVASSIHYGNPGDPGDRYIGMAIPTHNETHAIVHEGATVRGNVYAGGNMAPVGYTNTSVGSKPFPQFVALSSVRMDGGTVKGDVYGGGRMAAVYGSNEVQVSGGFIGGALYGGNDRLGMVAQITNRVLPESYNYASDGITSLSDVHTYVSVTGRPDINTVYGGGNGDYKYDGTGDMQYCDPDNLPIQSNIFVDINIDGYQDGDIQGGHINTVYGGGNGVTVTGSTAVLLNVKGQNNGEPEEYDHVGTIYGGNNKGHLEILSDLILQKGRVHTVYGGCNQGAMIGNKTVIVNGTTYNNVGSIVRLRNEYTVGSNTIVPTAKVTGTVYGGCRMNGVNKNSLVLVEGGDHADATIFGGSDISGAVAGTSLVVVSAGTHNNGPVVADVFGGGNGNYDYDEGSPYEGLNPPYCDSTHVEMKGGTVTNLFAGGYAGECGGTTLQVDGGTVSNRVFGGGNMAGLTKGATFSITHVDGEGTHISDSTTTTAGTSTVTINDGVLMCGIYGGNNISGSIAGVVNVNVYGGNLGTSENKMAEGIFGGGYGKNSQTADNVTVTINKPSGTSAVAPTIYADVYGGSALGQVNTNTDNLTKIDFLDGTLYGTLYGGGMGSTTVGDSAIVNGDVRVNLVNGSILDGIYGGCNIRGGITGDIQVNVNGGNVGSNNLLSAGTTTDVFGGGYGNQTATTGNVEVNVRKTGTAAPMIYGDVYGGSGFGDVNTFNNNKTTSVNILDGFIKKATYNGENYGGNVYGGGLGDTIFPVANGHFNYPAHVNGKVYVNIGANNNGNLSGNATIEGSVYGCNNVYGSPLDSVFVNVYKTAHGADVAHNHYPTESLSGISNWTVPLLETNSLTQTYALYEVFGGGNKAAYKPRTVTVSGKQKPRATTVHVYGCEENTIQYVYGGGNAADVGTTGTNGVPADTRVIIDGGRIKYMFGGGNGYSSASPANHTEPLQPGYNPGANIYGTASSLVYAGLIDEVYGGANMWGSIDTIDLHLPGSNGACKEVFGKVFGCANAAPINHDITTTVGCGVGPIGELYGGSNLAYIGDENDPKATVTLNLYGGNYKSVFGGSKGYLDPNGVTANDIEAHIYGNVVLNLYGGTVETAFGGSDQLGNVYGTITVNVDSIQGDCPLVLDTVFGAGNVTYYQPNLKDNELITSPIVNLNNGVVRQAVFGGGKGITATTTANPQVNIGQADNTSTARVAHVGYTTGNTIQGGDVYGGGFEGAVLGGPVVNVQKSNTIVYNKVFGGGDMANVDSTTVNIIAGTVKSNIYGGCNQSGNVNGDIAVNILGGTLGTSSTNTVNVFGGGYGENTSTTGDITVTFGGTGVTPVLYGDIYGGSALGVVNNTKDNNAFADHLTKVEILTGTVNGTVFGGGFGQVTGSEIAAHAYGNTKVDVQGGTITTAIYGGCNVNGEVYGSSTVELTGGTVGASDTRAQIFGGGFGQKTKVKRNVTVNFGDLNANQSETPILYGELYGGSAKGDVNTATAQATPYTTQVNLNNGTITGTNTGAGNAFVYGAAYGGALGQTASQGGLIEAKVYGKIYVKVGEGLEENAKGNATLTYCNIYGCNNAAGCPQDQVYVDVYKTAHTDTDDVDEEVPENNLEDPIYYAIHQVFGGGNEADFNVQGVTGLKTNVHIYNCDNTVYRVFGGGNAADVPGVNLDVQGGRYDWVFGGGNGELGQSYAANITENINISIGGGLIQFLVNGSNMYGTVAGDINETPYEGCETLITNHFCGSNSDDIFGDVVVEYFCPSDKRYVNLYGGSNYAQIYGDIHLTIRGGEFQNVFGGSRGRLEDLTQNISGIASSVHKITQEDIDEHPELTQADLGRGGNVYIIITGGSIGNLYGACDINGNVEGKITIEVNENDDNCHLFIGNIYGAGNHTDYNPSIPANGFESFISPEIKILNGTVGGGFNFDHSTEANPIINTSTTTEIYEGNIFGGGNIGEVVSNPQIIIGDKLHPNNKITIEGDVFGGGNHGSVTGSPKVIIAPTE